MEQIIAVTDQTINEALRLGTKFSELISSIKILKKYSVDLIDVSLENIIFQDIDIRNLEFRDLLRCNVNALPEEIIEANNMGFSKLVISWTHKEQQSLENLRLALDLAKTLEKELYLRIENAASISLDNLQMYCELIKEMNICRLIFCDKYGDLTPLTGLEILKEIQQKNLCTIEFHGNNTFDLATANSLAAFRAGVKYIGASVGGVGVPSNAALEEVLMSMKYLWNIDEIPSGEKISEDCRNVLGTMNIDIPVDKPIVGSYIFAHESGIHVDGIHKNPSLYELIKPEDVGSVRRLIIGKHSGTASIRTKFSQWNMDLTQTQVSLMLEKVRDLAEIQKGPLSDDQLKNIYINEVINNTNNGISN